MIIPQNSRITVVGANKSMRTFCCLEQRSYRASSTAYCDTPLLSVRCFRAKPKRDGQDYDGISGVTHMLNNTDSVLKKDEVKQSIVDYEELFEGARTEVCFRSRTNAKEKQFGNSHQI